MLQTTWEVLVVLVVGVALAFPRLARGPGLPDHVTALELIADPGAGGVAAYRVLTGQMRRNSVSQHAGEPLINQVDYLDVVLTR